MMMKKTGTFCLILAICWLAGPGALAQRPERGGRRWRGPDPFQMTDEDREAMYDRMVGHYQERFVRDYELTDEQGKKVKARLAALKALHRAYAEPLREEFTQMGRELHNLFSQRRAGGDADRERMREIMERMREMREGSPLMNWETVTRQVESLLPAEQVEQALDDRDAEALGEALGALHGALGRWMDRAPPNKAARLYELVDGDLVYLTMGAGPLDVDAVRGRWPETKARIPR